MMNKLILTGVLLSALFFPVSGEEINALELHFIDVGYGEAILLRAPDGGDILIDTGYPRAREKLFSYLKEQGVGELEYLIVTHPHPDHLGNAVSAAREFGARRLRDNGQRIDRFDAILTRERAEEYEREFRGDDNYSVLQAGDSIAAGELVLDVLWPPVPAPSDDWNTNSLVLMARYREFRALLTGDLNIPGERMLLAADGPDPRANLLKLGHHGAGDASSPEFVAAVSPEVAVVSVGPNPWGYPDEELLNRLEAAGIRLYRTDRDGTVVFRCREDGTFSRYPREDPPLESGFPRVPVPVENDTEPAP